MDDKNTDAGTMASMDPQFGHLLSNSADIAERILRYMTGIQLNTCARVCSLWNSTAKRLKCRRTKFAHCFEMKTASGSRRKPDDDGIPAEVVNRFLERLDKTWCEPGHALVFAADADHHLSLAANSISSYLPSDCQLILACTRGIVGTPDSSRGSHGHPVEVEKGAGLSGLLLPLVLPDGVQVRTFAVSETHFRKNRGRIDDKFKRSAGLPVGDDIRSVKCVLWFIIGELDEGEFYATQDVLLDFEASCGPHRLALGGAYVGSLAALRPQPKPLRPVLCAGLCFSGDGVRSASILITGDVKGARAVEKQLRRLKRDSGFEKWEVGETVGFMFVSKKRGVVHHGRRGVETDAFAEVFPGVTLMGFFGEEAFGGEHLPLRTDGRQCGVLSELDDPCMNEYTTAFVLLGLAGK